MAQTTNMTAIQYRTLNTKKGPAVHSSRTQNDKTRYHRVMKYVMEREADIDPNRRWRSGWSCRGKVAGVEEPTGFGYQAAAVVLATGTFLSGLVHIGFKSIKAGRAGEFAAYGLAVDLKQLGFQLGRMKTGTPPRLRRSSIDFTRFAEQDVDTTPTPFSHFTTASACLRFPATSVTPTRVFIASCTAIWNDRPFTAASSKGCRPGTVRLSKTKSCGSRSASGTR